MKNIIIVGSGGLAKDIYPALKSNLKPDEKIKGFLVDDKSKYTKANFDEPYLGTINKYIIDENDYFLIAFGNNPGRAQTYQNLKAKGAKFFTFIHPSTLLPKRFYIGDSVLIGAFCIIGEDSVIKDNVFINKFVNVGHDSTIFEHSILCPYVMISGGCTIGQQNFLATRSTIAPNIYIGDFCTISAHTFVKRNICCNKFLYNTSITKSKEK
ncbi:MAG: acetyltransferase [Helicobacter sp.]|uniref:acetyltransferase n=1 Tax=Helicobacter sp. TaxID=218 RepID=UPI0037508C85|nr:acetyltransferase [Helicobacter sp.]